MQKLLVAGRCVDLLSTRCRRGVQEGGEEGAQEGGQDLGARGRLGGGCKWEAKRGVQEGHAGGQEGSRVVCT